ncbi:lipase family protein [Nocardia altamirensis]|uniref:lipase family protein n=1 Tax=Nocardia altamirensis TaxID=472158 RepID=UPI00084039EB|nr:lipase family protein [Nocardia altamirensis]
MKHRTLALAAAVVATLYTLTAGTAAAEPEPAGTPGLDKVFNGFVIGQIQGAQPVPPDQAFQALLANDPFYQEPPRTGAEAPGTLLKAKKVDVMFLGITPPDIEAYKLMYVTTGIDGVTPVVSTGIVMIPNHGAPVGEKKVISYQEANDSVGWSCHPSTQWTGGDPLDGSSWSALGPLALMFDKGYAVMISDVGNDGDRNPHAVFAGKFAAHAQLDGVRAALAYQDAGLNPEAQVALFGIAGGGVGAAFSAELQPTYAPELNVKSALLEGMVVNPRNFMRVADGSVGSGFALATLLGLEPAYPEIQVNAKMNPAGMALANAFRTQCQTPAYFGLPLLPLNTLFNSGLSPADEPAFQRAFEDNILGRSGTPKAKVAITSCAADDSFMSLVPAKDAKDLADTYRAGGTEVTYQPTNCSMVRMLTDMYGWGTDLFGMQTIDWIDSTFE